ncbi:MAG: hypothetical protein RMX97_16635 [Nostoc sp. DedQUE11]|nr:hypothetical protein [Nostoc sp. DedQUE11]
MCTPQEKLEFFYFRTYAQVTENRRREAASRRVPQRSQCALAVPRLVRSYRSRRVATGATQREVEPVRSCRLASESNWRRSAGFRRTVSDVGASLFKREGTEKSDDNLSPSSPRSHFNLVYKA